MFFLWKKEGVSECIMQGPFLNGNWGRVPILSLFYRGFTISMPAIALKSSTFLVANFKLFTSAVAAITASASLMAFFLLNSMALLAIFSSTGKMFAGLIRA